MSDTATRTDQLQAAHDKLQDAVAAIVSGEDWQRMLHQSASGRSLRAATSAVDPLASELSEFGSLFDMAAAGLRDRGCCEDLSRREAQPGSAP